MYPRGHAGISLIFVSLIGFVLSLELTVLVILAVVTMWSSIIPDIDVIGVYKTNFVEHRGFSHTIWFGLIMSSIFFIALSLIPNGILYPLNEELDITKTATIGCFIGIMSHIFSDCLNETKIEPFNIPKLYTGVEIGINKIRSDSRFYNNFLFALGLIMLYTTLSILV